MRTLVFTAAIGDTDVVRPPRVIEPDVTYLCFSDREVVAPYLRVHVYPEDAPMLAARRIKILADHPMLRAADALLWHDASYQLSGPVSGWVAEHLVAHDIAGLRHPRRGLIETEARVVAKYGYLHENAALGHVARYRAAGFTGAVITATGLLARRVSPTTARFNALWWGEAMQWSGRDQTTIDYAAWVSGASIRHLDGTIRDNPFAGWRVPGSAVPA